MAVAAGFAMATIGAIAAIVAAGYEPDPNLNPPAANSSLFEGLPEKVVVEVLENPRALSNVAIWPTDESVQRNALWQGMAINFTQCRQMLGIYEIWSRTGEPASLPELVLPSNPAGDVVASAKLVDTAYRKLLAEGRLSELAAMLTNESGCGVWIPATPGDVNGPLIADVVKSSMD